MYIYLPWMRKKKVMSFRMCLLKQVYIQILFGYGLDSMMAHSSHNWTDYSHTIRFS